MNPHEKTLLLVLDLLTMLHRSRTQQNPKLPEEEQIILIITKEHIALTGLTVPTFINTLNKIGHKGYLFAFSIYEKKYHSLFREFQTPQFRKKFIAAIESDQKNKIPKSENIKIGDPFLKLVPDKFKADASEALNEDLTYSQLLQDSQAIFKDHNEKVVSYVILSPYRKIEKLLSKLEVGDKFEDIQDQEIWYNFILNTFHYNGGALDIGKTKRAKEVFKALFSQDRPSVIFFDEVPESSQDAFNKKEQKAYYDSINGFLSKDLKLKKIFSLHQDRLEIQPDYRDKAH